MDEDAPTDNEIHDISENEYTVRQRIINGGQKETPTCRTRFDKLATPNRRLILSLYQDHGHHLPKDKVEKIKDNLQRMYAMTPEETEKYFAELRQEARRRATRNRFKKVLKRELDKLKRAKQKDRALKFVERLLKTGMNFAFHNPVPPLVSVRLRNLSDIILEQICDLRNIDHPDREDPDQVGLFLIAVADWIAIVIEHIYYEVQLKKNKELEALEAQKKEKCKENEVPPVSPAFTKTDTITVDIGERGEETDVSSPMLNQDIE